MEEWRPVREFPEHYEISNKGVLRRINPYRANHAGRTMTPGKWKAGYIAYTVNVRNKTYARSAHRMVADAFLGPIPAGMHVNHKNGDKADCRVENLEIVTNSENRAHSYRVLGIKPNKSVETNVNAKLTWDTVDAIRSEYATGETSHAALSIKYGVCSMTILRVVNNRAWKEESRPSTP